MSHIKPKEFPSEFLTRLRMIVPDDHYRRISDSFERPSPLVFRVNRLKASVENVCDELKGMGVRFDRFPEIPEALSVDTEAGDRLKDSGVVREGRLYQQGFSSMYVVKVLDPQPGERVLDLCAAPGSKTSQIAAVMDNSGEIIAVEAIRQRFYKLKSVLSLLNVTNTTCICLDGRRFRLKGELFDRVSVDAPCSSEGRFRRDHAKTYAYWSTRKIREMVQKQRGLLLNAGRQLKPGGVLVYSTCTFAPEENEGVIDWFLRKTEGQFVVESIALDESLRYPAVKEWEKKRFDQQVQHCARILPGEKMEGFFITKFVKN